ncbi:multiheme c-type cytochrome [Alkalimarinus coralli]|uniref:multiheme c-type cytochrome n=1 Tax=Alkalimarinus coralli TaxID=2935863 RepID=UPI00202AF81C|nr:multiheme c-type cytochrome [Alkalimarinus coralli]
MIIQCLLIFVIGAVAYAHKDKLIVLKKPPESLAQWYKPENKRQVWLHTMFSLRREMQAVRYYIEKNQSDIASTKGNTDSLEKWSNKLSEHYLKIAKMVPEWSRKLEIGAINQLQADIKNQQYGQALNHLETIRQSCDSCHSDYRTVTALKFRAPDFSSINISPSVSFNTHMAELTEQVNQVKIFSEDGMKEPALASFSALKNGLTVMGEVCSDCHKKDTKVYPGDAITQTMNSLEESLKSGTTKDQGRYLGTLAVQACARCHGTHRLTYDMKSGISNQPTWLELIKH